MFKLISISVLLCLLFQTSKTQRILSKFRGIVEQLAPCENNEKLESPFRKFRMIRVNRTHRMATAEITFKRDLGENIATKTTFERNINNGWMELPGLPKQNNLCKSFAKFIKEGWMKLMESFNMEHPENCPQPAGTYKFKSFANPFESSVMPLLEGKYRMKQMFLTNDGSVDIYCLQMVIDIRPL